MHSIAVKMRKLREKPGSNGLVTANGWYLTKQSIGVYSTRPAKGQFEREDPKAIQSQIDALPHPAVVENPEGTATVETYTVVHGREGMLMGIVVGRDADGRRFVANTPDDEATLKAMESTEQIGRTGQVGPGDKPGRNLFVPD